MGEAPDEHGRASGGDARAASPLATPPATETEGDLPTPAVPTPEQVAPPIDAASGVSSDDVPPPGSPPPPAGDLTLPPQLGEVTAPVPATRSRGPLIAAVSAVVVIVLGVGAFFGVRALLNKAVDTTKPVVIPATLGGLAKATDSTLTAAATQLEGAFKDVPQPIARGSAIYGSVQDGQVAILAVIRSDSGDPLKGFFNGAASGGVTLSGRTTVGNSQCAKAAAQGIVVCGRTANNLFVAVFGVGKDDAATAALVDEAFALQ